MSGFGLDFTELVSPLFCLWFGPNHLKSGGIAQLNYWLVSHFMASRFWTEKVIFYEANQQRIKKKVR